MVGIDIGSHSIKAVLLSETETGLRLEALAIEPMPKGAMSERNIQDIEAIGNVIIKLKRKLPKSLKFASVAVSGQTVITKVIFMDVSLSDAELESQIEIEADSLIPYPLDEVSLDFEKLSINSADPSKINVLLSAARTESVEARVGALSAANLTAKVVDVESYALSRAMDVYYQQLPSDAYDKTVAVVDIGAVLTLVSVVQSGETIYTRDQVFGGDQYTNSIVAYYNKSFDEAEIGKTTGDLPPNYTFEVLANNSGVDREFTLELAIPEGLDVKAENVAISTTSVTIPLETPATDCQGKLVLANNPARIGELGTHTGFDA